MTPSAGPVLEAELSPARLAARIERDRGSRPGVVLIHPRLQNIHRVLLHGIPLLFSLFSLERGQNHGCTASVERSRADLPADIAIDDFYCMGGKPRRVMVGGPVPTPVVRLSGHQ